MARFVVKDVELLKILTKYYSYRAVRQKGSHIVLIDDKGHRTTVPYHNRELTQYTLHQILRETGLTRDDITKYL